MNAMGEEYWKELYNSTLTELAMVREERNKFAFRCADLEEELRQMKVRLRVKC